MRWMAERTVYLVARKPFLALFAHLTHLLVYGSSIFQPAALDYTKALRTLLSYPPHLASLDAQSWKILVAICWAALLRDDASIEEGWQDELDNDDAMDVDDIEAPGTTQSTAKRKSIVSQANIEMASLIPTLLASPAAPLLPSIPGAEDPYQLESSIGYTTLLKIQRFFAQYSTESSAHLPVLRSLNIVLAELELNCQKEFTQAGFRLLPHLVNLWTTRDKVMREQVVIALDRVLPSLEQILDKQDEAGNDVQDNLRRTLDHINKETSVRWGLQPIDMSCVRLDFNECPSQQAFRTSVMAAGFDFTHEVALNWCIIKLYARLCHVLRRQTSINSHKEAESENPINGRKRRKMTSTNDAIEKMFTS